MAQYRHLPIYRLTYELLQRVMVVSKDFPREYKFTLGQKIKDEVIDAEVSSELSENFLENSPAIQRSGARPRFLIF